LVELVVTILKTMWVIFLL